MKSNKLSTIFLLLLMVFTLTMSVGCGKENSVPKDNGEEKNQFEEFGNESEVINKKEKKKVKKGETKKKK